MSACQQGPADYILAAFPPVRNPDPSFLGKPDSMTDTAALPADIAALSFEDALRELEQIVQQLERGQVRLDEAVTAYERGSHLKRHCERRLAEARTKVEKIMISADGTAAGTTPFDPV
ncbi:hypothetical protein GCM10027256_11300 [Novispirillum itersonii subsp. nipponicum]